MSAAVDWCVRWHGLPARELLWIERPRSDTRLLTPPRCPGEHETTVHGLVARLVAHATGA
jgi:hypothetical protein